MIHACPDPAYLPKGPNDHYIQVQYGKRTPSTRPHTHPFPIPFNGSSLHIKAQLAGPKETDTGMALTLPDPPLGRPFPSPGLPPGFPLLSPHLESKTQPIPISSFLLNLALSHPRGS